jgi:hypothetical protein
MTIDLMHPFSIHFMSDTTTDMSLRRKYMLLFVSNRGPGTGEPGNIYI